MNKGKRIGDGAYGVVYEATSPRGSTKAVKRNLKTDQTDFFSFLRETQALCELRGFPFNVCLEALYSKPFSSGAMSPLLGEHFRGQKNDERHFVFSKATCNFCSVALDPKLSFKTMQRFMVQLLLALEYIHGRGYIHRDIKPSNILLYEDELDDFNNRGVVQICDFGLAKPFTYQDNNSPGVITAWYRSPEVALGNELYDYKADVWSMGCVFYEMLTKKHFFRSKMDEKDENKVVAWSIYHNLPDKDRTESIRNEIVDKLGKYSSSLKRGMQHNSSYEARFKLTERGKDKFINETNCTPKTAADLLSHMLCWDHIDRWSATQCLNSPFFDKHREYINYYRETYKPVKPEHTLFFKECNEMEWLGQLAIDIYCEHTNLSWYTSHRILFQAVDMVQRHLQTLFQSPPVYEFETDDQGLYLLRTEMNDIFKACLYLSIKFFCSLQSAIPISRLGVDKKSMFWVKQFEDNFIESNNLCVYRDTVYESGDDMDFHCCREDIFCLIVYITRNPYINGKTCKQALEYYLNHIQNQAITYALMLRQHGSDVVVEESLGRLCSNPNLADSDGSSDSPKMIILSNSSSSSKISDNINEIADNINEIADKFNEIADKFNDIINQEIPNLEDSFTTSAKILM